MITSFEYDEGEYGQWSFSETRFEKINLLVGASGTGKTRFLAALFNISRAVVQGKFSLASFRMTIVIDNYEYHWHHKGETDSETHKNVTTEKVTRRLVNAESEEKEEVLIERSPDSFRFCDRELPKLPPDIPGIALLKEEEFLSPLYKSFAKGLKRDFQSEGLRSAMVVQRISVDEDKLLEKKRNLKDLWIKEYTVSTTLYFLEKYFPECYKIAVDSFKNIFPSIIDTKLEQHLNISAISMVPLFFVKEKWVEKWIELGELSSGMQKVLLIIIDVLTLSDDSFYMIDEYENSLGINAIDFLPDLLIDHGGNGQFFITTHHPYLINNMPIKHWRIFNRKGSAVTIKNGLDLQERYGKSKQEAFTQLINDPYYLDGIQ